MKIGVVGMGYVGLSTAACMATKFECVGVDVNEARVSQLKSGQVPLHEKGVEPMLKKAFKAKRLSFSTNPDTLSSADAIFIAVGTPSNQDGSIDLSQVKSASASLAPVLGRGKKTLVLVKSTVVPGTTRDVVKPALEAPAGRACGKDFYLCANPEFLREGTAVQDTLSPDRLVLGAFDRGSLAAARSLYRKFYGKKIVPVVETTPEGAELTKYASNSFLASKVSFVNLLARVCELYPGTDVGDVARGMGLDPRIGHLFLQAGPGFGGSCFPKDVGAFLAYLKQLAIDSTMLEGTIATNDFQPEHVLALAEKAGPLAGKEVAVLGLAFKAETDDVRGSRSIPLVRGLLARGAKVRVYDPVAMNAARAILGSEVRYTASTTECLKGAEAAITMTAWRQFKELKARDYARLMKEPVLIDARRLYDPAAFSGKVRYSAVGLGQGSGT